MDQIKGYCALKKSLRPYFKTALITTNKGHVCSCSKQNKFANRIYWVS